MPSLFQILKTSKLGAQAAPDMLTALIASKLFQNGGKEPQQFVYVTDSDGVYCFDADGVQIIEEV